MYKNLNELEREIYDTLKIEVRADRNLKIIQAAKLCNVSTSKISKFCKKLGFENYKQYKIYISTNKIESTTQSAELNRISNYIKTFNQKDLRNIHRKFTDCNRIVLYGFGPSLIALEYFAYRLRMNSNIDIITTSDETVLECALNKETLVLIYTVSGKFRSFEKIVNLSKKFKSRLLILQEELDLNTKVKPKDIFYLTNTCQYSHDLPYNKTRTIFFIFIEELISYIQEQKKQN